jgi:exopolysaccharide biosynthesis polyprenyl glycosylphosphotransferase
MLQPSTTSLQRDSEKIPSLRVINGQSAAIQWRFLSVGLVINDVLMIGLAFLAAYYVRFSLDLGLFRAVVFLSYNYYQMLSLFLIPVWIVIFAISGLYRRSNLLGGTAEYSLVFRATGAGILALIILSFLIPGFILSRGWLALAWISAFLFVGSGRFIIRRIVYAIRKRGYFLTPAIIVGANQEGIALAAQLMSWQTSGLQVAGFVDDKAQSGSKIYGPLNCLGDTSQLDRLIRKHHVGELILSNSALSRDDMLGLFKKYGLASDLNLHISSGLFEIITTGMDVREFAYVPLVRVRKARLNGIDRFFKLLLDYAFAIPSLFFMLPLLFVIGLIVKLDSPGPVFHRRTVMGMNGSRFDAFKIRTMHVNGDEILAQYPNLEQQLAQEHKLKDDPRVTRVGRFLRKASLDELPQIINVLKRDMSLVGPRIIAPGEMSNYGDWGLNLLTVPPGITGLWQISGRSNLGYQERVQLDMHYIRNWSIWLDLQILWRTIPAVILGRGAY